MLNETPSVLECCDFNGLPEHDFLFDLLNKVTDILEQEISENRPADSLGNPGGLVMLKDDIPSIVIPDIHARPKFIKNVLNFNVPKRFLSKTVFSSKKETVLSLLAEKQCNCICAGDAFHTERTIDRWIQIQKEFDSGDCCGPAMKQEMTECLASFCALLQLKILYPENFHFIKGNHENITNKNHDGDRSFYKYADEAAMVKAFIANFYGEDILYLISCYESLLPLMVQTKKCVVSHAEPALPLTKEEIINVRTNPRFVYSLIWTKNGDVTEPTAQAIIYSLFNGSSEKEIKSVVYFAGHRPVKEVYETRQNGRLIQFHNTEAQRIAIVNCEKKFNLKKDFFDVNL